MSGVLLDSSGQLRRCFGIVIGCYWKRPGACSWGVCARSLCASWRCRAGLRAAAGDTVPCRTRDIPAHQYRAEAAVSQRGGILYLK